VHVCACVQCVLRVCICWYLSAVLVHSQREFAAGRQRLDADNVDAIVAGHFVVIGRVHERQREHTCTHTRTRTHITGHPARIDTHTPISQHERGRLWNERCAVLRLVPCFLRLVSWMRANDLVIMAMPPKWRGSSAACSRDDPSP
jgi:hypothetical protein